MDEKEKQDNSEQTDAGEKTPNASTEDATEGDSTVEAVADSQETVPAVTVEETSTTAEPEPEQDVAVAESDDDAEPAAGEVAEPEEQFADAPDISGLIGRKVGMTQIYDDAGSVIPVTVLELGPCTVLQVRTLERDGYQAVQLGFADKPRRLATRPERGHVAKLDSKRARRRASAGGSEQPRADCEPKRLVREFRISEEEGDAFTVGQQLTVEHLKEVGAVDVMGTSKGRGFAGVMKRHNFQIGRAHV